VLANRSYVNQALAWAAANSWQIGPEGPNSADAFCCGQTYIDLYRLNPQPVDLADISSRINAWIASSATNQLFWIDAFYMAGPTFARMGNLTGDTNYHQKLWQMYSYMKDGIHLFDATASLWYRDATFIYPAATNAHGGKVFWSRGNGWVFAGLARVLQQMQPTRRIIRITPRCFRRWPLPSKPSRGRTACGARAFTMRGNIRTLKPAARDFSRTDSRGASAADCCLCRATRTPSCALGMG
jgi:rhamnogalacturonyl hydrolase YesR